MKLLSTVFGSDGLGFIDVWETDMKTEKVFFKMIEMHCTTCKPIVEKQLMDEEAVEGNCY